MIAITKKRELPIAKHVKCIPCLPLIVKNVKTEQNVPIQNRKQRYPCEGNLTLHQAEECLNSRRPTHGQACLGERGSHISFRNAKKKKSY
jgi:hypothetical protein